MTALAVVGVDPGPEWSMCAWAEPGAICTGKVWPGGPGGVFVPDVIVIEWPTDQGRYRRRIGGAALRQTEAQAARWRKLMFEAGVAVYCVPSGVLRLDTFGWHPGKGRAIPYLRAALLDSGFDANVLNDNRGRDNPERQKAEGRSGEGEWERTASHRIDALVAWCWGEKVVRGELSGERWRVANI